MNVCLYKTVLKNVNFHLNQIGFHFIQLFKKKVDKKIYGSEVIKTVQVVPVNLENQEVSQFLKALSLYVYFYAICI